MAGPRLKGLSFALVLVLVMALAGHLALHSLRTAKETARAAAFAEVVPLGGAEGPVSLSFKSWGGLLHLPAILEGEALPAGLYLDSWSFGALPGVDAGRRPALAVPDAEVRDMPLSAASAPGQTLFACQSESGVLGTGLLGRGRWQLDYPAGRLSQVSAAEPLPAETAVPLALDGQGGLRAALHLPGAGRVAAALWYGTPLPLVISQDLFEAAGGTLPPGAPLLRGRLWEGPGLEEPPSWRLGILPRLEIGALTLEEVPALVEGESRGLLVLGGRLFSGSRLTFDLPALRLHAEALASPALDDGWPGLSYGLVLGHDGEEPVIAGLWENSPAWQAGLRPGDRLISMNRLLLRGLDRDAFCAFLIAAWPRWEHGRALSISVMRGDRPVSRVVAPWNALDAARAAGLVASE